MTPLAAYLLLFTIVGIGFIFAHLVAGKLIRPNKPDAEKGTIYECGEPTIGSAWVQFDLRFYVVALLFVVFDVEVAFFFPWAEVFGKANAVATAEKPTTAEEYVEYAKKVQDLSLPTKSVPDKTVQRYEAITGRRTDGKVALDKDGEPVKALDAVAFKDRKEQYALASEKLEKNRPINTEIANEPDKEKRTALAKQLLPLSKDELIVLDHDGPLRKGEFEKNREAASTLAWGALVEVLVFFGVLLVGFAYLWRRGDLEWVRSTAAERLEGRGLSTPTPPGAPSAPARESVAVGGPH